MTEVVFEHCAADLLTRAAAHAARARPLGAAAMSGISCRRVGRGRVAAGLAASGALVAMAILLWSHLSAAFLPLSPGSLSRPQNLGSATPLGPLAVGRASRLFALPRTDARRCSAARSSRFPAMANPVPTAIDPAVAALLLNICLSQAAQVLGARGKTAEALPGVLGQPGRRLRAAARRPAAQAGKVLRKDGVLRGTATLVRAAATQTVSGLRQGAAASTSHETGDWVGKSASAKERAHTLLRREERREGGNEGG